MASAPDPAALALAPVWGLAAQALVHVPLARLWRRRGPYPPLVAGSVSGVMVTLLATAKEVLAQPCPEHERLSYVALNTLAALGLAFGYFNFVNLTIASLRLRLLSELLAGGPQTSSELLSRYGTERVIEIRLQRLLAGRHLVSRGGRLHPGRRRFLFLAHIFDFLRRMILGRGSVA